MNDFITNNPKLVAHRGYASVYPENSMSAFQAAVDCGCQYLELDVQLTKDFVPVIIHDINLLRTGGEAIDILNSRYDDLSQCSIGESHRFGEQFHLEKLPRLSEFSIWLSNFPDVKVFVEIKEESIEFFGNEVVFQKVLEAIRNIQSQIHLISFDATFLLYAKQHINLPIGYVLNCYDSETHNKAELLQPNVLICNYKKIPDDGNALWQGGWDWFLYEFTDSALAMRWVRRGVSYIETMDIKPMLEAM